MATYKSEFSLGDGRLKTVSAFQYDDVAGSLSASVLLKLGAGLRLDSTTLSAVALGTGGYAAENGAIATQGYVDQAVAGVTPGVPGDATYIDFTGLTSSSYLSGQVVAIGSAGLIQADSNSAVNSNAIGVVIAKPDSSTVRVQTDGQVQVRTDLAAFNNGDLVWVASTAGDVVRYSGIVAGEYAVQVGIISDKTTDKIVLQPRIFGQTSA